ncbi:MAG: acetyl-CoA carboxylase biotin carboxylase subunit, partial [Oscillospiraceae bacterium]
QFSNVICLGERDCSIQRKNQKLIEESPSIFVDERVRKNMIDVCKKAVLYIGYENAGTIEFLYDKNGNFYFMEMNVRLQVEYPVTEMVTGIDLIKWQIKIAAGEKLTINQKDIKLNGHSIECRINAESPSNNFSLSCGTIKTLRIPGGAFIRFDSFIYENYEVKPYYDSMLAKLIVHGNTRKEAIDKMASSLSELVIDGVDTNINYHLDIIKDEDFIKGDFYTNFINIKESQNQIINKPCKLK